MLNRTLLTLVIASLSWLTQPVQGADIFVGVDTPKAQRVSFDQIDHTVWDQLLKTYVNEQGMVDYKAWKASAKATQQLDGYLAELSRGDSTAASSRESKLAYWINAYNAVTVKGILEVYPTTSIRNHTAKLWGYNIWKNLRLRVGDDPINLNDIEHEVLRKMNEPRIHFAIVCASIGCPRLLNEAYVADRLEEQLATNSRHFFAQSQNFRADKKGNTVYLSSILSWFGEDFGDSQAAVLKRIGPYLPSDDLRSFVAKQGIRVRYTDYDWGINEQ